MSERAELRVVNYRRYDESLDLTGKDLLSLMDRPRAELGKIIH
jgi:hypothetical protein